MEFHVQNDWVIIKPEEMVSKGGILLPDGAQIEETEWNGRVVGVGDGILTESGVRADMVAREGARVKYLTYTKRVIELGGQKYDLVRDRDIVGWYEE